MVYYLKVNRNCEYAMKNIQHWIDTIEYDDNGEIYIICDNPQLEIRIKNNIKSSKKINLIRSEICEITEEIVINTCEEKWHNAGYAHLTTFLHAKKNGIKNFWNIDADDTFICLQPQRCYALLIKAEEFAQKEKIDLFSLDMWTTVVEKAHKCFHWTFGVTYTNGEIEWFKIMKEHCYDEGLKRLKLIDNLDKYFTYLAILSSASIETFYVNYLKFIHYSDDFFSRPEGSGFYFWKNKYLYLPIISNCFGAKKRGKLKVSKKVYKIEMDISEKEELLFLNSFALDKII